MKDKEKQICVSTKKEVERRNKRDKEKDELSQALLHYATAEASGGIKTLIDCEGCAFYLYEMLGYRKIPGNSVVLSREEYEKLISLYDCEQGSYMTSSIGDLPLTVEGLRKAVDEITRLNRVESELQELNIKYYNEAKDSRRELKQASKETAEKFLQLAYDRCLEKSFIKKVEELAEQFGVEIKE